MSMVKKTDNWGYNANLACSNWTGRTLRESVGGEYAREYSASKRIPPVAYAVAFIAFITLLSANFI